ncbi:MAG TPA: hypothetical protein PKA80_12215 [Ignavibacteriaceae bacterium]|nr:hypothetical protein [Ignavibacteriaceae bacterium]
MSIFSRKTSEFDKTFDEATKLSQSGRNSEAITMLNRAIQMQDARGEAFLVLGQLYDNLGQKEKAISTYKKGISAHPDFVDNYFDLAVSYGQDISTIRNNLMDYPIGHLAETIERSHEYLLKAAYLNDAESKKILAQQGIRISSKDDIIAELLKISDKRLSRRNYEEAKSIYSFILYFDKNNNLALQGLKQIGIQ